MAKPPPIIGPVADVFIIDNSSLKKNTPPYNYNGMQN